MPSVLYETSLLSDQDIYLFNEGTHLKLYEHLGAHPMRQHDQEGTQFGVWAPNANRVAVSGDFNGWSKTSHMLSPRGSSGIWEGFIPGVGKGARYKYHLVSNERDYRVDKADPMALHGEEPPQTASVVWDLDYTWNDAKWRGELRGRAALEAPMAIYEVHLGSWRHPSAQGRRFLNYRELAPMLADHVSQMGFTHVEFLPLTEHPFYGSWGYQTTSYFAPTARYGTPQDLMFLIDHLHQHEIGVLLDWVPSHFPNDEHGLGFFDGTHLYEHADPRKGFHPDWNSLIFNYGRNEVRSFLLSSAQFWLEKYHVDGLRVDAVASMLYLDYSRKAGEWIPNEHGGNENLEAISLLRRFNEDVYRVHPSAITVAEESTAWPKVSRPTSMGGLGFGAKWDMGWMHDTLRYMALEPVHRKYHHNELTFRGVYAFSENYVLPLSHDEVVHGKGSLLGKMPGDAWQKFANLRLLYGYMYTLPGKKLLFMGGELGQWSEWNHESSLQWNLVEFPEHHGIQRWIRDLNTAYRAHPALHEWDCRPEGFEWIEANDGDRSVLAWLRKGSQPQERAVIVANFTPVPRDNYQVGVPLKGHWAEVLNSDAPLYGGTGRGNLGGVNTVPVSAQGRPHALTVQLPPLGIVVFKYDGGQKQVAR